MASSSVQRGNRSSIERELYFLIERFLSAGPCKSAAKILRRELDEHGLLPKRIDWQGREQDRSFESLLELNRHIGGYHLLKICERLGPLLDEKVRPCVMGVRSLLGAGSQSLLRTAEDMRQLVWPPEAHVALLHGRSMLPPINLVPPNMMHVKRGLEMSGQSHFNHVVPRSMYDKMKRHSRKLGHLSAVYCVLFDRTGGYIFTGADDQLVKVWQASDGRLKATLRGHSAEITDMAVNFENTLLASGSCDKTIRVWCLKTKAPVAVLQGHTGMITSLQFSPIAKTTTRFLASTGGDACVCFWQWDVKTNQFNPKPVKYIERSRAGAQLLCSSFSPGGMFFAAGSTDHVIRMYHFTAGYPEKIGELEKHVDRVDSICYSHHDNRFLSGSRDGLARIWRFERSEWRSISLKMSEVIKKRRSPLEEEEEEENKEGVDVVDDDGSSQTKLKVTMVGWSIDDAYVVTAINDFSLKVWCSYSGKLRQILRAHEDEVFVLEPSPIDQRIMLSAGHDGNIIIWDIIKGEKVKGFFNLIEGQGHGAVFDCKFSPDGTTFCATDSHGHLMIHGFGSSDKYKKIPDAVFFHTDYRPLVRDSNNYVLDEQTQQAPHLMPPPFLVDIDGNPYPPAIQRLVPGRENCRDEQLVPQLAVNEEGEQEVMGDREPEASAGESEGEGAPSGEVQPAVRPSIDEMIQQLQRQQDEQLAARGEAPLSPPPQIASPGALVRSISVAGGSGAAAGPAMVGMRRVGETEGVRQSLGNIQQVSTSKDLAAISRRIVVRDLQPSLLRKSEEERIAMAEQEIHNYIVERKKKSLVVKRESGEEPCVSGIKTRKKTGRGGYLDADGMEDSEDMATNRLTQRALYDTDDELEEDPDMWNDDESIAIDGDDSGDYSDWGANTGSNLEPPKRTSKRVRKRKRYSTEESEEEEEEEVVRGSRESSLSRSARSTSKKKELKPEKQPIKKKKRPAKCKATIGSAEAMLPGRSPEEIQEILVKWRPPDWLTEVIPRKQPYFPQMGDELMYFRQGHELYVNAVKKRGAYPIDISKNQPWHKNPSLREQEFVKIVYVRYDLLKNGVRLCTLKLKFMDPVGLEPSGGAFTIKYHDMPDVIDFLVLKQNYDVAVSRNWKPGDRFRSMIDDSWWMGEIESQVPFQQEFPDSLFQCFKVRWDNAERECLSPWDLEPMDESRCLVAEVDSMHDRIRHFVELSAALFGHKDKLEMKQNRAPSVIGGGILVTQDELKSLMYKPKPSEWSGSNLDGECDRIVHGLEQAMEHSIAEPFLTPVDLNKFPGCAMSMEYPMDLNTIRRRLQNRFYRRVNALQFDVRYIETNARKFNEPRSQIVKSAQILTDALLSFISEHECCDVCAKINTLSKGRKFQWSSDSNDSGDETEEYDTPGTSKKKTTDAVPSTSRSSKRRLTGTKLDPDAWKEECRQLLETIVQCEDSAPFREPVNIDDYPKRRLRSQGQRLNKNYYEVIEQPTDLQNIRQNLENGVYTDPTKMAADMKLMFSNSRAYNTNKRSRIYSMTLRLSAMFESKMKELITTWRRAVKHQQKHFPDYVAPRKEPGTSKAGSSRISDRPFSSFGRAGPSGLTNGHSRSSDYEEEINVTHVSPNAVSRKRPRRERKSIRRIGYLDSDPEDHRFPEPKPDYTDDDFEVEDSKKNSPKKKKLPKSQRVKKRRLPNGGDFLNGTENSSSSTRYSTRASTGVIKARKYTNEGFFTEEDDEDTEEEAVPAKKRAVARSNALASDSDTEVDEPIPVVKLSRLSCKPNSKHSFNVSAKSSKKHSRAGASNSESNSGDEGEEHSASGSSSASESEANSSGWETEPHSPATRSKFTQGSQFKSDKSSSASSDSSDEGSSDSDDSNSDKSVVRKPAGKARTRGKQLVKGSKSSKQAKSLSVSERSARKMSRQTRNCGKQRVTYNEDSDNDNSDATENAVSVSMRGRVRRPTARAKAYRL